MFARKSEFGHAGRSGLAQLYAAEGWRTIAFDFRGHGESSPSADWGYDDLVRVDLPAVVECARARAHDLPVVVVGHSLGGHVALASQAAGHLHADGLLLIAANVWLRRLESSRARWGAKLLIGRAMQEISARVGRLPAKRLGVGSDDATARFVGDVLRVMREDAWVSEDGVIDYLAALRHLAVPVHAIVSEGDTLMCHPDAGERFVSAIRERLEITRIRRGDDGSKAPSHMGIVTTSAAHDALLGALRRLEAQIRPRSSTP
jgi:predicted alpha/beta hydrolase